MADRRRNNFVAAYRSKQTTRVTEYYYQASSSKSRAAPAKAPCPAPAPKKTVSRVTKPQTRKPTVKQLQDKVNSQTKKIDQIKKQLIDVKKLVQKTKKVAPVQIKNQSEVDSKIVINNSCNKQICM